MSATRWIQALGIALATPVTGASQAPTEPSPLPDTLTVEWAVDAALLHYPALSAAQANLRGAGAGGGAARSAWWPSLSFNGNATSFQLPMLARPLHELDASQIVFDRNLIQGNLFLDFLILDGGGRRARIRQADAVTAGAQAGFEATGMAVIQLAVGSFVQVRTLREILAAEEAQVTAFQEERNRARLFLEAGRAAEIELLRAEAALSQATADMAITAAALQAAEDQLARVAGVTSDAVRGRRLAPVESASASSGTSPTSETVDSLHPVLRQSWSQVLQADAVRSETKSAWIPNLGLSAGMRQYGTASGDFTNEWQAGVVLSYPLFTGFRRSREIERSDARLVAAREEYRLRRLEVDQELDEARAALRQADARVQALEQAVTQFTEVVRIEALALEAGAGVQRDFLDAQAALFQAQASLAQARNLRVLARVREASALGSLDPSWIRTNLESVR
jgi:cobalt-zinc-cadmium efflux system outer membrane protein